MELADGLLERAEQEAIDAGGEAALDLLADPEILALSSATLTGAIDRMEAAGLVRRVAGAADARVWLIEPTMSARDRRRVEEVLAATEQRCFAHLDAADRRALLRLLAETAEALTASSPGRRPDDG